MPKLLFGVLPTYSFNTVLPYWRIGLEIQFCLLSLLIMLVTMRFGFAMSLIGFMMLCSVGHYVLADYCEAFEKPFIILTKLNVFLSGMLLVEAVRRKALL